MNRKARNGILAALCGAMAVCACSCAFSQTYPVTVDGEKLRAGIYILAQRQAFSDGGKKITESNPDFDINAEGADIFSQSIDGKPYAEWINEETLEKCREYVAVLRLFDQYGLSLTGEEIKGINDTVKQLWDEDNYYAQFYYGVNRMGEYYEKFGVGQQSYKDLQTEQLKHQKVFDHLYGEGGKFAATQEEINNVLSTDYLALNYFPYDLKNGDSAQSFADRIANGESYEAVYRDYAQALSDEEAAASAAETTVDESGEIENVDSDAADTPAETTTVEEAEKDSLIQIMKKSSNAPSEEFMNQTSAMNVGDVKVITVKDEDSEHVYVVQKLDILSYPDATASTVDTVRVELREDDYEELLRSTGAGYTLTTDSSINMYDPKKLADK